MKSCSNGTSSYIHSSADNNQILDKLENLDSSSLKMWIVSILFSLLLAALPFFYTIYSMEDLKSRIRESLTRIIETSVIHDKTINDSMFERILNWKLSKNDLSPDSIKLHELVKQAETNIIETLYIDANKKKEYEKVFFEYFTRNRLISSNNSTQLVNNTKILPQENKIFSFSIFNNLNSHEKIGIFTYLYLMIIGFLVYLRKVLRIKL